MDLMGICLQVAIPWEQPFEARHIKSMELVVLATLEWRVAAVTAASFLDRLLLGAFDAATLDDPSALHAARAKSMGLLARTLPGARTSLTCTINLPTVSLADFSSVIIKEYLLHPNSPIDSAGVLEG